MQMFCRIYFRIALELWLSHVLLLHSQATFHFNFYKNWSNLLTKCYFCLIFTKEKQEILFRINLILTWRSKLGFCSFAAHSKLLRTEVSSSIYTRAVDCAVTSLNIF